MSNNKIIFRNNLTRSEALSSDTDNIYFPTDSNTIVARGKEYGVSTTDLTTLSVGSSVAYKSVVFSHNKGVVKPVYVTYNSANYLLIGVGMYASTATTESQSDGYYGPIVYVFTIGGSIATLSSIVDPRSINMYTDSMSWVFDYLGFGIATENRSGLLSPTLYQRFKPSPKLTGAQLVVSSDHDDGYIILNGVQTKVPQGDTTFYVKAPGDGTTGVKFPRAGMTYYAIRFISGFVISGDTASINFDWYGAFYDSSSTELNRTLMEVIVESGAISGTPIRMDEVFPYIANLVLDKDTFPFYSGLSYKRFAMYADVSSYVYSRMVFGVADYFNAYREADSQQYSFVCSSCNGIYQSNTNAILSVDYFRNPITSTQIPSTFAKSFSNLTLYATYSGAEFGTSHYIDILFDWDKSTIPADSFIRTAYEIHAKFTDSMADAPKLDFPSGAFLTYIGPQSVLDKYVLITPSSTPSSQFIIGQMTDCKLSSHHISTNRVKGSVLFVDSETPVMYSYVDIVIGRKNLPSNQNPAENVYVTSGGYSINSICIEFPDDYEYDLTDTAHIAKSIDTSITDYYFIAVNKSFWGINDYIIDLSITSKVKH